MSISRLASMQSFLVAVRHAPGEAQAVAQRLAKAYPALNIAIAAQPDASLSLIVGAADPVSLSPEPICWGRPIGRQGVVDAASLLEALRNPQLARDWGGAFVIAGWIDGGIRLVSSPSFVSTLRHASGPRGEAFGTRALVALLAAGVTPRIDHEVIAEQVHLDYVLGTREVLAEVQVEPDAAVIDLSPQQTRRGVYWSLEERLGRRAETNAEDFRTALLPFLQGAAADPRTRLGFTAGADSAIVARVAANAGLRLKTFTLGPGSPDAIGAAKRAVELGWEHTVISALPGNGTPWQQILRNATWFEGAVRAEYAFGGGPRWGDEPVVWFGGSGSEMGRAFYWHSEPPEAAPVDVMCRQLPAYLPAPMRAKARERVHEALAALPTDQTGLPRLDVLYAAHRMRKWLGRLAILRPITDSWAPFLHPNVASVLMRLPIEQRRASGAHAELIAPWRIVASKAPKPSSPLKRMLRRLVPTPLLSLLRPRKPLPNWDVVTATLAEMGAPERVIYPAFGREWFEKTRALARHQASARRELWNALSIEALAVALEQLPRD